MRKSISIILILVFAVIYLQCHNIKDSSSRTIQTMKDTQTQSVVNAATAFINLLNPDQRKKVLFPFVAQKKATAANFQRTGASGKQPEPGSNPATQRQQPQEDTSKRPADRGNRTGGPGGNPGMGSFGGFVGEQYGQAVWSNFPVSDVPRPGLQLGSLNAAQRNAAMHLLQVLLSAKGYQKVLHIMGSDQALADGGTNYASGTEVYTLGIFGAPSTTDSWMIQ